LDKRLIADHLVPDRKDTFKSHKWEPTFRVLARLSSLKRAGITLDPRLSPSNHSSAGKAKSGDRGSQKQLPRCCLQLAHREATAVTQRHTADVGLPVTSHRHNLAFSVHYIKYFRAFSG